MHSLWLENHRFGEGNIDDQHEDAPSQTQYFREVIPSGTINNQYTSGLQQYHPLLVAAGK